MQTIGSAEATTGTMIASDASFFTLEQPWCDNEVGHSCVPAGLYDLIPYYSPRHDETWCLSNPALNIMGADILTPSQVLAGMRSMVEIHSANWAEQLEGCVALGLEGQPMLDPLTGRVEPAVENSRDAVAHLISILGAMSTGHTLLITREQETAT
jgi:hypothetical protein